MSELDRKRVDEVRRLLVDAFMSEDYDTYARCVHDLETLIGVPHGDRNPMARTGTDAHSHTHMAKMRKGKAEKRQFKFGNSAVDAEMHEDGMLVYSIKYGQDE